MILYVNGDSHSAGAEAVNDYCFAEDDYLYRSLGKKPHPDNERASYGCILANELYAILHCDAESGSSNTRIIRTTLEYLQQNEKPDFVLIGWSTWEREEWLYEGEYYQVNNSGADILPEELKERYKLYVSQASHLSARQKNHEQIYSFHLELLKFNIKHLFFNCYSDFYKEEEKDWHGCYISPYDPEVTYWKWLTNQGFKSNKWYHFRADAHRKWAEFLLPHLTRLL